MTNQVPVKLSSEHVANLTKLADYLESLPADYNHFNMGMYLWSEQWDDCYDEHEIAEMMIADPNKLLAQCGTVACALGHGPAAGIPVGNAVWLSLVFPHRPRVNWSKYADNFIPHNQRSAAWGWVFSDLWEIIDNTHYGAAARIRYLIANRSVPSSGYNSDIYDQFLNGEEQLIEN